MSSRELLYSEAGVFGGPTRASLQSTKIKARD
ncbi:hypothetical protein EYZ11_009429 [Aspergillus tanneri]|uniref:Uncharacterized protein n=1 Tax=Aspergillus tanneri TaxID=1220188 RepID=A0A4S3J8E2_9EURO|nr:hypothetical protein EYZ11_009429 [Aspergillus tanneri]